MTQQSQQEVKLAKESTPLAQFQDDRTRAITEMFERDEMCEKIHSTSRFFVQLDNSVKKIISRVVAEERKRVLEEIKIEIQMRKDALLNGGDALPFEMNNTPQTKIEYVAQGQRQVYFELYYWAEQKLKE